MTHIVMFDIDGTLVDSVGFDSRCYAETMRSVLDVEVDDTWRPYRHVTDTGILEELLASREFDRPLDELRATAKQKFIAAIRARFASDPVAVREIAGAKALFEHLARLPGVRVAIATGGWAETARLKLAAIGIDPDAVALATSSDRMERVRIMQLAEERALGGVAPKSRTYFGDGAWDKRASAELGYRFIGVGRAVEHDPRFDDFRNRDAVLGCLGLAL
jgi:beta-phosphoglucomutase-like phosphatase (HAD superfamily)